MIRTLTYVDVDDFEKEARSAYIKFQQNMGLDNGIYWPWCVGEKDSVPESYIGKEKCAIIDTQLRKFGLIDGDSIRLVYWW